MKKFILSMLLICRFLTLTRMTKVVAFSILINLPTIIFSQHKKVPAVQIKRDLSLYEQDKTYDFKGAADFSIGPERSEFREYLWQQWSQRRRTKITATFYTIEGDPTTSTFYIEPYEGGRWRLVIDSVSLCCWHYARQKPKKKIEIRKRNKIYNDMERVKEVKDSEGRFLKWNPIPAETQVPSRIYRLHLKKEKEESWETL